MLGLINRAVQLFLRDTYGPAFWDTVAAAAELDGDGFEAMLFYDDSVTEIMVDTAAALLGRSREMVLEDLGTYLVSHPNLDPVRRLLRFGGVGFVDFLYSLEDMKGRAHLAVPELALPEIEVTERRPGRYRLFVSGAHRGFANVLCGLLRAMADDYGALVLIEPRARLGGAHEIGVELLDHSFAEGRSFALGGRVAR